MCRLCLILVAAIFSVGLAFNGFALDNGDGSADTLSAYLHAHRLPLVEARIVSNNGQRTLMLYGYVATSYGKRDAEDQARDYMDDPDIDIVNRIKVRPELLTMGTNNSGTAAATLDAPPDLIPMGTRRRRVRSRPRRSRRRRTFPTRLEIRRITLIRNAMTSSC